MRPMQKIFLLHRRNERARKEPSSGDFQTTGESDPPKFPLKHKKNFSAALTPEKSFLL